MRDETPSTDELPPFNVKSVSAFLLGGQVELVAVDVMELLLPVAEEGLDEHPVEVDELKFDLVCCTCKCCMNDAGNAMDGNKQAMDPSRGMDDGQQHKHRHPNPTTSGAADPTPGKSDPRE